MDRRALLLVAALGILLAVRSLLLPADFDEAVYVGMGKAIASGGQHGFYEVIRAAGAAAFAVIPALFGLPVLEATRILFALLSLANLVLLFLIGKQLHSPQAGILAAGLLSVMPIFLDFSGRLMPHTPGMFFLLLGTLFFLQQRWVGVGVTAGLALLTHYPNGAFLIAALLAIAFLPSAKRVPLVRLVAGFAAVFIPYLILASFFPSDPVAVALGETAPIHALEPIIFASAHFSAVAESGGPLSYLLGALSQNILLLFALAGIFLFAKAAGRRPVFVLLLLALIIPILFFSATAHKEFRFSLAFLPFAALFAGIGLSETAKKLQIRVRPVVFLGALFAVILLLNSVSYLPETAPEPDFPAFAAALAGSEAVVTNTPHTFRATDAKGYAQYYSAEVFLQYVRDHPEARIVLVSPFPWTCLEPETCQETLEAIASLPGKQVLFHGIIRGANTTVIGQ